MLKRFAAVYVCFFFTTFERVTLSISFLLVFLLYRTSLNSADVVTHDWVKSWNNYDFFKKYIFERVLC